MSDRADHIRVRVAEYPEGAHDADQLLNRPGGDAEYERMIREAKAGPLWMIGHLDDVAGHDLTSVDGKVGACEDMVDVLLRQPPIARWTCVRELARKLDVPENEVRRTLNETVQARSDYYVQHPDERPEPMPDPDTAREIELQRMRARPLIDTMEL